MIMQKLILGCGNFGGVGSSTTAIGKGDSPRQAAQLLTLALDIGICRFDTANTYGGGKSEEIIGNFFHKQGSHKRLKIELHSKVGNPNGIKFQKGALDFNEIIYNAENSLRRLKTDYLDLYLIHEQDQKTPLEETLHAFSKLIQDGKILRFGISNINYSQMENFYSLLNEELSKKLFCVQNEYHYLRTTDQTKLIPFLKTKNIHYSAYSPLAGGLLSGKYCLEQNFPQGSRLTLVPGPYEKYFTPHHFEKIRELQAVAIHNGRDITSEALHFITNNPEIDFVVIGPRKKEHYENLGFKFQ